MKQKQLHILLKQNEEMILSQDAAREGLSKSQYIKQLIFNKHSEQDNQYLYIPSENKSTQNRNIPVMSYYTEDEFMLVSNAANGESLSSYVSRCAVAGQNVLEISIDDEYYDQLSKICAPLIYSLYQDYLALKGSSDETDQILKLLIPKIEEANNNFLELLNSFRKNRNGVRQTMLRELRKKCDYLLDGYELVTMEADK